MAGNENRPATQVRNTHRPLAILRVGTIASSLRDFGVAIPVAGITPRLRLLIFASTDIDCCSRGLVYLKERRCHRVRTLVPFPAEEEVHGT